MSMPKVLLVGDYGAATGFELVVRSIGTALQTSGQVEVIGRGVGYDADSAMRTYGWPVRPISTDAADPLGITSIKQWVEEDKPDCLLIVNDLWNVTHYLGSLGAPIPTVAYYPVDTPNLRWSSAMGIGAISVPVTYTQFGASESARAVRTGAELITRSVRADATNPVRWLTLPHGELELPIRSDRLAAAQEPGHYEITPHGLDQTQWYPMDQASCRAKFGIPQDAFVITNINTNQFRKRLDSTIRIFAKVAQQRPDALLVLHCAGGERQGWDLAQLATLYGVRDRVLLIHERAPYLSDNTLRELYNVADINLSTSGGEGWGLNGMHSAACGIPQVMPDWSNNPEIWDEGAYYLPVSDYRHEPRGLNTAHCLLDTKTCATALLHLADSPDLQEDYRTSASWVVATQRTWESVGQDFVGYVHAALNEPEPEPVALSDWAEYRATPLVDPLAEFDVG